MQDFKHAEKARQIGWKFSMLLLQGKGEIKGGASLENSVELANSPCTYFKCRYSCHNVKFFGS